MTHPTKPMEVGMLVQTRPMEVFRVLGNGIEPQAVFMIGNGSALHIPTRLLQPVTPPLPEADVVERVARAIFHAEWSFMGETEPNWETDIDQDEKALFMRKATAAISTLRNIEQRQ